MADKAIGSLVEATVINDADRFVLEQSGQAKQISGATMISELAEALDGHGGIQSIDLVSGEGNVKTYRITFTDGTTYDYEVRDGESGNYAVVARNLAPYSDASGATQSVPFLSQGTGRGNGSATVPAGNYCQLKKKLGNTVTVNQHTPTDKVNFSGTGDGGWWILSDNFSAISGHKYLIFLTGSIPTGSLFRIRDATQSWVGSQHESSFIWTAPGNSTATTAIQHNIPTGLAYNINHTIHDLTLWFGSNDRIPSDLLSHPENWGRYYAGSLAYNAGTLESADGTVLTSIGRNFFDKSKATAHAQLTNDGTIYAHSSLTCSVSDYTPVSPNTDVYFKDVFNLAQKRTICWYDIDKNFVKADGIYASSGAAVSGFSTSPPNAHFVRCTIPDVDTCVFSLYYSGESGYDQYYPFSVLAEMDTGSEVLRSAGTAADEKLPGGQITRKVGYVDLGSIGWSAAANANGRTFSTALNSVIRKGSGGHHGDFIQSNLFVGVNKPSMSALEDGEMSIDTGGNLQICKSSFANYSVAQIRTALSGVYLYYELATPTTEQGTAFAENIPCNPVGSMSWENDNGTPQGAEIFYPYDYAGTLDSIIDALPSADGTYTFKATVANGKITYSWVAD